METKQSISENASERESSLSTCEDDLKFGCERYSPLRNSQKNGGRSIFFCIHIIAFSSQDFTIL